MRNLYVPVPRMRALVLVALVLVPLFLGGHRCTIPFSWSETVPECHGVVGGDERSQRT